MRALFTGIVIGLLLAVLGFSTASAQEDGQPREGLYYSTDEHRLMYAADAESELVDITPESSSHLMNYWIYPEGVYAQMGGSVFDDGMHLFLNDEEILTVEGQVDWFDMNQDYIVLQVNGEVKVYARLTLEEQESNLAPLEDGGNLAEEGSFIAARTYQGFLTPSDIELYDIITGDQWGAFADAIEKPVWMSTGAMVYATPDTIVFHSIVAGVIRAIAFPGTATQLTPCGQEIFFLSDFGGNWNIFSTDGESYNQVTHNSAADVLPVCGPDNNLMFVSSRDFTVLDGYSVFWLPDPDQAAEAWNEIIFWTTQGVKFVYYDEQ